MKVIRIAMLTLILMSVFIPNIRCEIGNLQPFSTVTSIEVQSSWSKLTDVARIEMPRNINVRNGEILIDLNSVIRKGDSVKISGGYNPETNVEFQGFVRSVGKNVPIEIECEDYMYLLKLDAHSFTLKEPNLKQIVNQLLTGSRLKDKRAKGYDFNLQISDTDSLYKDFTVRNLTGAQVLQQLTDKFPLMAYFRIDPKGVNKPVLVVGYRYDETPPEARPILRFGDNVPRTGWNLTYENAEDVKVKIKAISNLKNGKKLIVEVGDADGETRTRNYPEVTKEQLTTFANEELKHFKRDGFQGSVTAFGIPYVKHGDIIVVDDPVYTKESGSYLVDETIWSLDHSPRVRRKIKLGLKA
jgi:hypothetical protein